MNRSAFLGQTFIAFLLLIGTAPTDAVAQNLEQLQCRAEEEEWGTRQPTFGMAIFPKKEAARWGTLKEKFAAIDKNNDNQIN